MTQSIYTTRDGRTFNQKQADDFAHKNPNRPLTKDLREFAKSRESQRIDHSEHNNGGNRGAIEGGDPTKGSTSSKGGSVDITQQGKFGDKKTLTVEEDSYVIIHTSHANNKDQSIGNISGEGVKIVSKGGDGDNGIIIAKVEAGTTVKLDSNGAGSAQYAVVKDQGPITAFGGDDAGYPKGSGWTEVNVGGDAFYIASGHKGPPPFYSTEKNKLWGNTVTVQS